MKKVYLKERAELVSKNDLTENLSFTDDLVKSLPPLIRKHLRICGLMDKPVPVNANIHWKESYFKMSPTKAWRKIQTLQFNSIKPIARIAYMKFYSLPLSARDIYKDGYGEMKVKLFNLFPIAFENSKEIAQSALITSFAEFLILPGYFLLENVTWRTAHANTLQATLTDNGMVVTGLFHFNQEGLLYKFETEDRYYSFGKNDFRKVKYSGTIDSYKTQGDLRIAEKVKVTWHLVEGDFEYFKGTIDKLEYNVHQ